MQPSHDSAVTKQAPQDLSAPYPDEDGADHDARTYAAHYGVSVEEAKRRFALQNAAGDLEGELTDKESATFAGLWLEHMPKFRVVVQFVGTAGHDIAFYTNNQALLSVVEVRTAKITLADLEKAQAAAISWFTGDWVRIRSGINVQKNRVEIYVLERDRLNVTAQMEAAHLSPLVVAVTVQEDAADPGMPAPSSFPQLNVVPTDPFFPQQPGPEIYDVIDALAGRLVLVNGCLRLQNTHRGSYLVIWPYDYRLDRSANPMQVYDNAGKVVARLGDYIQVGGWETSSWSPLPEGCSGPFWGMSRYYVTPIDIHFPQAWPLVLDPATDSLTGKLISVNDCLRLQMDEKRSFLLIWPLFLSIDRKKNPVQVYSSGPTTVVMNVGEKITATGREILPDGLSDYTFYPIPDDCAGPYWGAVTVNPSSPEHHIPPATETVFP